nr:ribonuclease H-like domain-containing protein [Tanacetum cinerariifolium]
LNGDEEGTSGRDGSVHQPKFDCILDQPESNEQRPDSGSDSNIHQPAHGTGKAEMTKFKKLLSNKFKIKDLRELKYFLGIEVLKVKNGLCLSQRKYCPKLLHEFGLLACRPVLTPLPENIVLAYKESEKDRFLVNITSYQRLLGKLIYLTLTRPDISYAINCLSQHMHAPLKSHFDISLRLLKYSNLAPGNSVQYLIRHNSVDIKAISDFD